MSCRHRGEVIMALLIPKLDPRLGCVQLHAPATLPPGRVYNMHIISGSLGHRTSLDRCGEEKISRPRLRFEPRTGKPVRSLHRLCYPDTHRFCYFIIKHRTPYIVWFAKDGSSVVAKIHFLGYKIQNFK